MPEKTLVGFPFLLFFDLTFYFIQFNIIVLVYKLPKTITPILSPPPTDLILLPVPSLSTDKNENKRELENQRFKEETEKKKIQ